MATAKKKTNYISYELAKLKGYLDEMQEYLDDVRVSKIEDRLDVRYSTLGNPIVKVIASKESQIKAYREILEKLPKMLEDYNRLKKLADDGEEGPVEEARGGKDLPGIFKHKMLGPGAELIDKEEDEIKEEFVNMNVEVEDYDETDWNEEDDD